MYFIPSLLDQQRDYFCTTLDMKIEKAHIANEKTVKRLTYNKIKK